MIDEVLSRLEESIEQLNVEIDQSPKLSPNPAKQQRRKLRTSVNQLKKRKIKLSEHKGQMAVFGNRNSYSKTDHDATFMRVKEDPMQNGQLKPAYNVQIATNNQFITGFGIFQNPTDTRTFIPFITQLNSRNYLGKYVVADAGYGSEPNYKFVEDELSDCESLIPYGTMLREKSRKWQSDDRKVMNWNYVENDDYYIDPKGVRFHFWRYSKRTDKYGNVRHFKVYRAEVLDNNQNKISEALTPHGAPRYITVNGEWEYHKARTRNKLSSKKTGDIYKRRKIDVEPVFGRMKAFLGFNRFSLRSLNKVRKEFGIVVMALNMNKLVTLRS
ncbi:transposase [Secundilactobacillus oryzae JCM 18671]|uniref:Transposase n=1 Tax=Secundilactobacillus oryzae JCM 18671 TaxID=1291743 RepID=A0A081BK24_9LACO|nr:transposase [Secundilactobacillus oryzae]GAK48392.1 transposase [Secundilactobacillus oryzae JCM 18671]